MAVLPTTAFGGGCGLSGAGDGKRGGSREGGCVIRSEGVDVGDQSVRRSSQNVRVWRATIVGRSEDVTWLKSTFPMAHSACIPYTSAIVSQKKHEI